MKIFTRVSINFLLLFALTTGSAFGQPAEATDAATDSLYQFELLFPFDSFAIDSTFMDNARSLKGLHDLLSNTDAVSKLESIVVAATSSPDGPAAYNKRLAQNRANSLKSYILERFPDIDGSLISANADYDYWEGLIELVRLDRNVPGRDELLRMLDNPGLSDNSKSNRMKDMNGGATFAYLRNKLILRRLRAVSASVQFLPPLIEPIPEPEPEPEPLPEPEPEPIPEPEPEPEPEPIPEPPVVVQQYKTTYPVALRTNLLLDMVGGPNIGIEVPIGNHFSVAGDFAYAHTQMNNRFALKTIQGSLEGRYWFKQGKNILTGWNLGLYGTYSGRFDYQWNSGHQGDKYWSVGLSGGYAIPLSNSFNMDFSVMGGFVHSPEVRYYNKPQNGHLIWKETKYNVSRFKLTQVRVNLVWLLKSTKKVTK